VSYLSASIFLFGGALGGMVGIERILPIAVITFLAMISRELLKTSEDLEGDQSSGARTLPVLIGVRKTVILALFFLIGAIITSVIPFIWWGWYYLAGIGIIDLVIFIGTAMAITCTSSSCVKRSKATTSLKFGMFASLVVFTLSALFL
jgi:geranylgeranylglycerol-phosphate geranylgeranyltransferase